MKIFKVCLISLILTISCSLYSKPQYKIIDEKGDKTLNLNAFDFSMIFFEDIVFSFQLYEWNDDSELIDMAEKIFKSINTGGNSILILKNYDGKNNLNLLFSYLDVPEKNRTLITIRSNYNRKTQRIIESKLDIDKTWAIWFDIKNKRLIRASSKKNQEDVNNPKDLNDLNRATSYLTDDDESKHKEIEPILVTIIKKNNEFTPFAYIILAQYYSFSHNFKKANVLLDNLDELLKTLPNDEEKKNLLIVSRLTRNEIKFTEKLD